MRKTIQVVPNNCQSQEVVDKRGFFVNVNEEEKIITTEGIGKGLLYEISNKVGCPSSTTKTLKAKEKLLLCMEGKSCEFCG